MNFKETLASVELAINSKSVPLIIGESGIGKTSLIREFCNKLSYKLVTIDANLLKEGEIGGLPVVEEYIDYNGNKRKKTVYASHNKLIEVENLLLDYKFKNIILFIDEINRCEHAVQQELMNLILNREINGYSLDNRVLVIAAMNPVNGENYTSSNYSVVSMDPAQEDRFVWLYMESDLKTWSNWAINQGHIDRLIIEFINDFPEYLHRPSDDFSERATPRSWERVSNSYKIYENQKEFIDLNIFYNVVKGNVGADIAQDLIAFIQNYNHIIITPEDLFSVNCNLRDIEERLRKANHSKLYVLSKNILRFLEENNCGDNELNRYCDFLSIYPIDLRISIFREIKNMSNNGIYNKLLDMDKFIELFFSCFN
ncbi:MAG: AAA family ATPase [Clostridium sp.]